MATMTFRCGESTMKSHVYRPEGIAHRLRTAILIENVQDIQSRFARSEDKEVDVDQPSNEQPYDYYDDQGGPEHDDEPGSYHPSPDYGGLGCVIVVVAALVFIFRKAFQAIPSAVGEVFKIVPSSLLRDAVVTFAVVTIGIALFLVKTRWLLHYARVEIAFAIASAWAAADRLPAVAGSAAWPVLVGSAYLFVRGLDNHSNARKSMLKNGSPTVGSYVYYAARRQWD